MKRYFIAIPLILFAILLNAQTDEGIEPRLEKSDVENFIKNFKAIQKELDIKFDNQNDYESLRNNVENIDKINATLKKYGYEDHVDFYLKAWAITAGYSYFKLNEVNTPEVQAALDAIDDDKTLSAEEKEMKKQQVQMMLAAMGQSFENMVHEDDLAIIKPYVDQLHVLFEEK